jgi:hypothetical protein
MMSSLFAISLHMAVTVTPPCLGFVLRNRLLGPSHPNSGERAKQNQQRNDFHFFLGGRKPKANGGGKLHLIVHRCPHIGVGHLIRHHHYCERQVIENTGAP